MKREKLAFSIIFLTLFLATILNMPISEHSASHQEVMNSATTENLDLNADYTIYKNKTKFYAINGKLQTLDIESENASEVINHVLSSAREGATIIINPGEYNISTTMRMLKPLHVYAYGATFQVNASSVPIAFQIGDKNNPIYSPHSLKGAKIVNIGERGDGIGILLCDSHFGVLEDIEIWFFNFAVYSKGSWDYNVRSCILRVNKVGIKLDQDDEGLNRSNHFRVSGGYIGCETGIHITGNCQNVLIEAVNICDSSELGAGVWIEHAEHTVIRECYFENNPNIDIKIGGDSSEAIATEIIHCFFLVKKTAIKIEKSLYTRVEGCMAINDSRKDSALFIDMSKDAKDLICLYNFISALENNLFFGADGANVEWHG